MYKIAVIGGGHRITPLVKRLLAKDGFVLKAVCDIDIDGVRERYSDIEGVEFFTDARKMLDSDKFDGVFIGTRCSLHTEYAKLVSEYGIPLFLEKPVSINWEQLSVLEGIDKSYSDKVVVSFPLRLTYIVQCVKDIIDSGKIGKVQQVQAYNNVNYARGYYHGWYRDESETGGLFLQKSTHDLDYINYLLEGRKPVMLCAMESKQVFKGDMPEGLYCKDCKKREECPESIVNVETYNDKYPLKENAMCCFAKDTGNHDSASITVMYDDGMHAVYTQNFVARKDAGRRGARLIGYLGTVEFDFNTGTVQVFYHNQNRTELHKIEKTHGHSGGDKELIDNFANVIKGTDLSHSPLSEGILSAKMCLLSKDSAQNFKFYKI